MNPYSGDNFFSFFGTLLTRLFTFHGPLVSDEVQLIVLGLISMMAATLGSFLVLRKNTMLANSLSHTILLGIAVTYLAMKGVDFYQMSMGALLMAALVTALLTTLFTELLTRFFHLQEDASIGLVFSTLFALGIVVVTLFAKNTHIGTEAIMGNVDALHPHDVKQVMLISGLVLGVIALLFRPFRLTTFDPTFARGIGVNSSVFHYILMILTALAAISAFRAVGAFLFLALLVIPPLIARAFTKRLGTLIVLASGIGVVASMLAVALSRHLLSEAGLALSTAGVEVVLLTLAIGGQRLPQSSAAKSC